MRGGRGIDIGRLARSATAVGRPIRRVEEFEDARRRESGPRHPMGDGGSQQRWRSKSSRRSSHCARNWASAETPDGIDRDSIVHIDPGVEGPWGHSATYPARGLEKVSGPESIFVEFDSARLQALRTEQEACESALRSRMVEVTLEMGNGPGRERVGWGWPRFAGVDSDFNLNERRETACPCRGTAGEHARDSAR